jgi:hypothetical protein
VFLILVVGLALLIQSLVFRSLLVPITAVVGFLLTIGAALGATTFVFQLGNGQQILGIASTAPIISFLPVLLVAILFGLAIVRRPRRRLPDQDDVRPRRPHAAREPRLASPTLDRSDPP